MSGTLYAFPYPTRRSTALILKITCLCWLAAKLISRRLWLTGRTFPLLPVADFFTLPWWVHMGLYAGSLLLLAALTIGPAKRSLLVLLIICESISCLADQNRLQPWQYQYVTFAFIMLVYYKNRVTVFAAISFVIASTYFYSGLGKLNDGFIEGVWQKTILLRFLKMPAYYAHSPLIQYSGYSVPLLEMLSAVLLLFAATRKAAASCVILIHLLNLVLLGPLGTNYNTIVWPGIWQWL